VWREAAPAAAAARQAKALALRHRGGVVCARVLSRWRERAAQLARKREACAMAAAFRSASLLQRGWQAWSYRLW
jgi:hypothetical protein